MTTTKDNEVPDMLIGNINVGDRLEITSRREKALSKTYVSQVENVLDGSRVLAHVPVSYGQLINLSRTESYDLLFFTEKGMIAFEAVVEDFIKEDGFSLMVIRLTTEGERMQRREFFRFNCLLPMKLAAISDTVLSAGDFSGELAEKEDGDLSEGIIKDIGGGGIRFVSNLNIREQATVKCLVFLPTEYIITIGRILHKQFFPKSNYQYQYRVEFIGILPAEQEKIVRFIFAEHRKTLRKTGA